MPQLMQDAVCLEHRRGTLPDEDEIMLLTTNPRGCDGCVKRPGKQKNRTPLPMGNKAHERVDAEVKPIEVKAFDQRCDRFQCAPHDGTSPDTPLTNYEKRKGTLVLYVCFTRV